MFNASRYLFVISGLLSLSLALCAVAQNQSATDTENHTGSVGCQNAADRTIFFQSARSAGYLSFYSRQKNWHPFEDPFGEESGDWVPAQGQVFVPYEYVVSLLPVATEIPNLAFLQPNDIQEITFGGAHGPEIGNEDLAHLSRLIGLLSLDVNFKKIDDTGLVHLRPLTCLVSLNLSYTDVGSNGLKNLLGMSGLRYLQLQYTEMNDVGMIYVSKLPNLSFLEISDTSVSDGGFMRLHALKQLKELGAENLNISDASLGALKDLNELRMLHLGGNFKITDAGVAVLAELGSLEYLDLFETNISDNSIPSIAKLKNLKGLGVTKSRMSRAGVEKLRALMPQTDIIADFDAYIPPLSADEKPVS